MWPWNKKKIEKKSAISYDSFVNFLMDHGHTDLGAYTAIELYSKVGPLSTAINIISDSIAQLDPVLIDKDGEVVKEHEILTLLDHPNQDQTKAEFLKRFASFYLITGDCYMIGSGQVNKAPLAIWIPSPTTVNIESGPDGFAGEIRVNQGLGAFEFIRDAKWRFYDGPLREIWHTKAFNPHSGALTGQSILTPIYYDIEQYRQSSTHNLSLLKRGARPSGVFLAKEALTDDQFQRLKGQIDNYYTGSTQAGRPILADGEGMDYKDMMQTARDMDFLKLKENVTTAIFNQLKIPLPLISPENQSYANMQAANLQLYSNAVLPLADRIFEEMTMFLAPRFKGLENMRLSYDESKIDALDLKTASNLESKSKAGIFTINELRTMAGAEAVDGGDVILRPGNELPVAEDRYTEDNLKKPASKTKFYDIMRKNSDLDDEQLKAIANKYGLS